jgi:hypothetical protein
MFGCVAPLQFNPLPMERVQPLTAAFEPASLRAENCRDFIKTLVAFHHLPKGEGKGSSDFQKCVSLVSPE